VSGAEVAGLIVAVFWAILVSFLAVALARLARTLRRAADLVTGVTARAVPLLDEATVAVRAANAQLARVDTITADVQEVTSNASALSTTVAATLGGPLVKVAAFGYGVRRAMSRGGRDADRDAAPAAGDRPGAARRTVIVGGALPGARRGFRRTRGKG
jgi:Bacterial protein of unknown function (DUF948)